MPLFNPVQGSDTNAATLQPFPLWLQYGGRLTRISGGYSGITLDLAGKGFTYASPDEVVAWLTEAIYFIQPNLGSAPLTIDLSGNALPNTEDILDAIAAALMSPPFTAFGGGFTVYLQGGTNAPAGTPHQDATLSIQLPPPIPANAGTVLSASFGGGTGAETWVYDAGIPFAGSNNSSGGTPVITIGVADSPSMADVASFFNNASSEALGNFSISLDPDGSGPGSDPVEDDYPFTVTGRAVVTSTPGAVAAPSAAIATIESYNDSDVIYNS